MNKQTVSNLAKSMKNGAVKHSPKILTGVGIASMITTTVLAVKATPKALQLIEEAKAEKEEYQEEFTKIDYVKAAWKPYVPAVVTGVVGVGCLLFSNKVSTKRTAAFATLYTLTENTLSTYKEKMAEIVGEEKAEEVKRAVAHERTKTTPNTQQSAQPVYIADGQNVSIMDALTGQETVIEFNKIKAVENDLNSMLISDDYISLNEYLDRMGFETSSLGQQLGWRSCDGKLEIQTYPAINKKGMPCLVLDFNITPEYDYEKICR